MGKGAHIMKTLLLHPDDSVKIVLNAEAGNAAVPLGHKIATKDIAAGGVILKFGQPIGLAVTDIASGDHVHSHNCAYSDDLGQMPTNVDGATLRMPTRTAFEGYKRPDGQVGTRNFIGILSTVNCSATVCSAIAKQANETLLPKYQGIDGFVPIVHELGCGMSGIGSEAYALLQRTVAGYRAHPNFAATLVIGLGCEVNQMALPDEMDGLTSIFMTIQSEGGTRQAIRAGLAHCEALAGPASKMRRETVSVEHLTLGMQCGGSDAFSALSANPALGVASDLLVAAGGTSILSETPEIFGAEHLLLARADEASRKMLMDRLAWWRSYAKVNGASLDNNPSPGNKAGGLTTILEKSLGAVAKGGQASLSDVVEYAQRSRSKGLIFMDTPGYDPVSATGQIAGGANLIAFTTGRGSCFGSKPAPTIKLASTSMLFNAMPEDMDIDCGGVVTSGLSIADLGAEIYEVLLNVASGQQSKSEINGLGDLEFAPWRLGAVI